MTTEVLVELLRKYREGYTAEQLILREFDTTEAYVAAQQCADAEKTAVELARIDQAFAEAETAIRALAVDDEYELREDLRMLNPRFEVERLLRFKTMLRRK